MYCNSINKESSRLLVDVVVYTDLSIHGVQLCCLSEWGSTFQRAMDHAFEGLIGKIIVSYLDDLTVFSKEREDHVNHLTRVFERCRKFGILLDPKNSTFVLSGEGIKSARDSSHSSTQRC